MIIIHEIGNKDLIQHRDKKDFKQRWLESMSDAFLKYVHRIFQYTNS